MKNNLLLEVERNLSLMGISKKVKLINEGRGEFSNRIWGLILQLDDATAAGIQKRATNLTKMLNNTGTSILESRKRALKEEIERMIREGKTVDEVIEYLERELTPEVMSTLEKKISSLQLIDDAVRRSLYDDLVDTNSLLRGEVLEDAEQEIAKLVDDPRFIDLDFTNQIKALNDFKTQLADMYSKYFGIESTSKILNDIIEEPIEKARTEVSTTGVKTLDKQTEESIELLKKSDKWLGDVEKGISVPTRLQKIAMLNELLAQLKDNAVKKLGILSDNIKIKNGIDNLIEKEIKLIESEVAGLKSILKTGWKNFAPRLSDFAMRVTTSLQKNLDKAKQEIDDLVVAMGSTDDIGPELAKTIRSKFAGLVSHLTSPEIKTEWTKLEALIREAYGEVEGSSIINLIKSEGEEKDWIEFLVKESAQGGDSQLAGYVARMGQMFTGWYGYISYLIKGMKDQMPVWNKVWWKRVLNWGLVGHTTTLREFMDSFIKAQYAIPGLKLGKIKGYNPQSLFLKYVQLWIFAKVVPTVIYSIIYGMVAGAMARVSQPSPEEIAEMTPEEKELYDVSKNGLSLIWYTMKEGFLENFDLFMSSNEDVKKAVAEVKENGGLINTEWKWYLTEFFDTFIPVEPMILEIMGWVDTGLKTPYEKTWLEKAKKKVAEKKSEIENELGPIKEKLRKQLDNIDKSYDQKKFEQNYSNPYHKLTEDEVDMLTKWTSTREGADGTEVWVDDRYTDDKYFLTAGKKELGGSPKYVYWNDNGKLRSLKELSQKLSAEPVKESIIRKIKNMIIEEMTGKKFGDDNFKHWKDTFTFKAMDEKNPGQYKEVKINMEDVMDRVNHYRKKYDEDDSFVRAVIDTHEDVVKIMFTKDLAHLQENFKPTGLAIILQQIRESRGEMEIWSVARPANGNWFLVKGDYTPNQLVNMDLEKNEPQPKEKEVDSRTEDDLKKKEVTALQRLKNNENDGIDELPKQVKDKIKEKLSRGWTTEEPFFAFSQFYETSEINTVFNDKIKIYKLKPSDEFFKTLVRESASIRLKKGFCKSLNEIKNKTGLVERQQKVLDHFIKKCEDRFGNIELKKYRQSRFDA